MVYMDITDKLGIFAHIAVPLYSSSTDSIRAQMVEWSVVSDL